MSSSPLTDKSHKQQVDKPEILKNWQTKLFILLLCVVSFYAGWQASRSHLVKECQLAGAQVSVEDGLVICQMPQ